MKRLFKRTLILSLLITANVCNSISLAAGLQVEKDFTIEAKEADKKQVPILVLFMDEDCEYCKIVLEDFLLPMQRDREFTDKVILRQIERSSGDTLVDFSGKPTTYRRFSGKYDVWGVPHVMLFDSKGQLLTSIEGLLTVDYYYAFLVEAIELSLKKIRTAGHRTE